MQYTLFSEWSILHVYQSLQFLILFRAVIRRQGPGISHGYCERFPRRLSKENKRKLELKEILSCLIPHLLVVFTRQLETLVTTLIINFFCSFSVSCISTLPQKICYWICHPQWGAAIAGGATPISSCHRLLYVFILSCLQWRCHGEGKYLPFLCS